MTKAVDWPDETERLRHNYENAVAAERALRTKIEQLREALKQAVNYADVASLEEGMPEGKQATRLTATWIGKDIHYRAEFDVKSARILLGVEQSGDGNAKG